MFLRCSEVYAFAQEDFRFRGLGHLVCRLAVDAYGTHSNSFLVKRKTLQDIVEALRLAGVLLETYYRAAFVFYEFFDERHDF
jgi:hypothetical protein